jgi:alkanesulfonate monooxygenase SsuD/methylene tetrahydromethanopterin reductase-like flavin-dependent oxidoreductase (luciferase family)
MKFSVWPNPSRTPDEVLELAQYADDSDAIAPGIGWHCIWYADHYMPNTGDESFAFGDVHECWTMLSAIAATTNRVRLGPLVAPTSVHHPALIANRAATLDQLSNGRFTLGLGAGWQINEHHAYGIELEPPGLRVSRFEESIQIVRALLDTDRTTVHGNFYNVVDAPCDPKPVQSKLPFVVGTGSPRMLGITVRHAQEWNTWGAPDLAGERRDVFVSACASAGIDPASLHTSVQAMISMTDDDSKVGKILAGEMGDRSIAGSDDHIVEQIGRYIEQGFDEMIVPDFTLGHTSEERLDAHQRFATNIAAQLA